MKLDQNVYFDEMSDEFENGSCRLKTRSLGQILVKPCVRYRGQIFSPIVMKLGQNVCLHQISDSSKKGHVGSKTRPLGHFQSDCHETWSECLS